jgi:GTP cyclohydrolase II
MTAKKTGRPKSRKPRVAALLSPDHLVERAAGELRRGAPVLIRATKRNESVIAVAAETVTDATLAGLVKLCGAPFSILTHTRAATLKIPLYTPDAVSIPQEASVTAVELRALADPSTDLENPLKGPFNASRVSPLKAALASVQLAKLAGLLPATAVFRLRDRARNGLLTDRSIAEVPAAAIRGFEESVASHLQLLARVQVPLHGAKDAELAAFRPKDGGQEHYAVIIGDKRGPALAPPGPVLTRIHSECFTGDFLGSLKCDCGDQLRGAIKAIADAGGGVLLYLAQEGRGIGLMNKLRAYRLQDEGFDTMEANRRLGFAEDERLYDIAARMLVLLGYSKVRLMTNNPDKLRALQRAGIEVTERVAHRFPDNIHNRDYLRVKAEKGGHLSECMDIRVANQGKAQYADWGAGARRCAVGRAGIAEKIREGDGVTPVGTWPLRRVLYRPDRMVSPRCVLSIAPLQPYDGWCEAPNDPDYNRLVRLPHRATAETMWRDDHLYDMVVVVGYNDAPVVAGKGSAIFIHLARADFTPTAGCVALALPDLLDALAQLGPNDRLIVAG